MNISTFCAGALGLLVIGLGFAISMHRRKYKVGHGSGDDPTNPLYKLCRAHGNATEYVPVLMIMMLYLGAHEPSLFLNIVIILTTISRYLHAAGLILPENMSKTNPLRFLGALGTYLGGITLGVAMII